MRKLLLNVMGITLMVMTFTMCQSQPASVPSTPKEALEELMAGNERYVNEECMNPRSDMDRVGETAPHQAPFAALAFAGEIDLTDEAAVKAIFDRMDERVESINVSFTFKAAK